MKDRSISLKKILMGIAEIPVGGDCLINNLCIDSRKIKPGALFLACPGEQIDARSFIQEAIAAGASAVLYHDDGKFSQDINTHVPLIAISDLMSKKGLLAARFYQQPSKAMKMIGITGTNGKTSCSQFIATVLGQHGANCAVVGTLGNGFLPHLNKEQLTTPDAVELQNILADLVEQGANSVAMEVSSHGLAQHRLNGVEFDIAVFTQLSRDHLDYHGDMQSYANAKEKLWQFPSLKETVINQDDVFGRYLLGKYKKKYKTISYSLDSTSKADVRALHCQATDHGYLVEVTTPWGRGEFVSKIFGEFNISNLLAVLAVAAICEVPLPGALSALSTLNSIAGRMQLVDSSYPLKVFVDYSHTPDALKKALTALRQHCQGELWCVFGCGGDRDVGKRAEMGAIAETYADRVVITNDNPRTESPQKIITDICRGLSKPQAAMIELDRASAIALAIQSAKDNDIVLVAGKGHEDYQIIGKQVLPFSDSQKVKEQLQLRAST